ncbi:sensor histidine kinase [Roseateles sp.]|uniref:sensor histidine kinase n=1 Tax=Roseateles sp. TaxID=1971397 RepID=UPI00392C3BC6
MGSGLMAYTPKRCCTTALLALVGGMACAAGLEPVSAPVSAAMAWATGAQAWLAAMLLGVALALGLLSLVQRNQQGSLFLAGMMLSWVLLRAGSGPTALGLRPLLMTLLVLCGVQYLLRQINTQQEHVTHALLIQCLVVPLSLLLSGGEVEALARLWHSVLVLELVAAMAWVLGQRWRRWRADPVAETRLACPHPDFRLLTALLAPTMLALLAELALSWTDVHLWWISLPWLGLLLPLAMLALGLDGIASVARSRLDAERRVAAAEQRMQERIAEVERQHAKLAEQKLEQVTERERKRIAADLHDDLGAKLLTIVHTSESDRISTLAREALEEMRLSVRGLTGKPVHLIDALGDWRAEVVLRLGQANILAEWKSPTDEITQTLQARSYVQTTRILRESVSNIIKHSGATHATISCAVQEGDFILTVQDNGHGIPAELDGRLDRGHGMASMKSRAKQMHGQCLVESGPGWGTVIRLTIPL